MRTLLAAALVFLAFINHVQSNHCDRTPEDISKPAEAVNTNRYIIDVSGNPSGYQPGETYIISLKANPNLAEKNHRFSKFTLVVEPLSQPENLIQAPETGSFKVRDGSFTRFHTKCRNTIVQTNTLLKTGIEVYWVAPSSGSGCVAFKATVFESSDSWFSDRGNLTKELCEEFSKSMDKQDEVLSHCCACEEAKYEVAFQGLWLRNTHPKNFPTDPFTTKFSDIVGASHKLYKSFWNYGGMATEGLRHLAEEGDTKPLEDELKEMVKSDDIRTVIKARELSYPNITETSYTVFRVDRANHLVSLVSKLTPSPDWIVGVANLELCTRNCSWIENTTLNLYPWDVGTQDGLGYTAEKRKSQPQQPIKPITSDSPNNPESPFFDERGEPVKPLARIHFTRQKLYEKSCDSSERFSEPEAVDPNCAVTNWLPWTNCLPDLCFQIRQRNYINPEAENRCQETLIERVPCDGPPSCRNVAIKCKLDEWSEWSSCSVNCGKGVKTRDRTFTDSVHRDWCTNRSLASLQETRDCMGSGDNCGDEEPTARMAEDCSDTIWGEWTPCSVTCGEGTKERVRIAKESSENKPAEEDSEKQDEVVEEKIEDENNPCQTAKETVTCYTPACGGEEVTPQPEDGAITLGGRSEIHSENQIKITQGASYLPVVDCSVSDWSDWQPCNSSGPCRSGYQFKVRHILVHPQNGGRACPRKLQKKRRCPCGDNSSRRNSQNSDRNKNTQAEWGPGGNNDDVITDCKLDEWTAWSPCTNNCGPSAVQIRTRGIKTYPSKKGKPCGHRTEEKPCRLSIACTDRRLMSQMYNNYS